MILTFTCRLSLDMITSNISEYHTKNFLTKHMSFYKVRAESKSVSEARSKQEIRLIRKNTTRTHYRDSRNNTTEYI